MHILYVTTSVVTSEPLEFLSDVCHITPSELFEFHSRIYQILTNLSVYH